MLQNARGVVNAGRLFYNTGAMALTNDFSWSFSRNSTFETCKRRYYYERYGMWGGWEAADGTRTRTLYLLRQVTSRAAWRGSSVHGMIEQILKGLRTTRRLLPLSEAVDRLRERMRSDFRASKQGLYRTDPKRACRLFEHEYRITVSDEAWRETYETAERCLRLFYTGGPLRLCQDVGVDHWLDVEELVDFTHEGAKVWAKPDFAYRQPSGAPAIIDWKTGRLDPLRESRQAAVFAFYAAHRWNAAPETVQVSEWSLADGARKVVQVTADFLVSTAAYIRERIAAMQALLRDPDGNIAVEDDFPMVESPEVCRWCNFRRICPRGQELFGGAAR